ncbi:MAG TPA: sodium:solute symporter family protein [Pyrinomonadaceae bacterium]|jgi:SSS family solute:Na+ symporter|nr:sodium:solute symporter family protein [Pyrinomonadaceae bacterium]
MTNFNWLLDGSIVGLYLLVTMIAGLMVRKYVGKVEHFLVAGREMDVYLGIASLAATEFGIVTCMYTAQNGYEKGFAGATPGILMAVAMAGVGLTGFVIKPLRDSGVITIPELLDQRFGPRVRWAAGVVIVLGGLLNMGVFLRTGGQFLVLVAGLDVRYLEIMMTALLVGVAVYTILGGMLSVLVTDFLQFVVMSIGLILVTILILMNVGWEKLVTTVETHYGPGGFNPFVNPTMGWQYVLFNLMLNTAAVLTWQTIIARVLAAKDTKTGRKVYTRTSFFFVCRFLIPGIWGIAALAMLGPVPNTLEAMPRFLSTFVPAGLMGILVAAMLAADMSTDSSYMLTWCSVIYNDILAPFRKRPWSERKGLFWNRTIIALIGIFLLLYGLWYPLKGDLWTYLGVTGTIYLASISVLLIACCYWKHANSWGAVASIIVSAVIPVSYLVMEQLPSTAALAKSIGPYYSGIATYLLSGIAMVVGSLIKPQALSREEVA